MEGAVSLTSTHTKCHTKLCALWVPQFPQSILDNTPPSLPRTCAEGHTDVLTVSPQDHREMRVLCWPDTKAPSF